MAQDSHEIQVGFEGDRAKRFELQVPVHYRAKGEAEWRTGRSKNISRSGVMFVAEEALPVGTELEIRIVLQGTVEAEPSKQPASKASPVACTGEVVRTVLVPWPEVFPAVGAKFNDYTFGEEAAPTV